MKIGEKDAARFIDHTLLKPDATLDDILQHCAEARSHGFAGVCVNPSYVSLASNQLTGCGVAVGTVVGFPLGANHEKVKVLETRQAIKEGADEIDMVMALGLFKSGDLKETRREIERVVEAAEGRLVKVILETGLLSMREIEAACWLVMETAADFVKTSTGFGPVGATVAAVTTMRRVVGKELGVKASGGIRNADQALTMIRAGADRIGTSSGVTIIEQWKNRM
ncbi:deoxyribose-phosphate aldolase [Acidobacteriota bacterium]